MLLVEENLKVSISYLVRDLGKNILEEIPDHHPFAYIHGSRNIISGLENALEGRKIGDKFSVTIPYNEGYGPFKSDLIIEVPKNDLKDVGELWLGMELEMFKEPDLNDFQIPENLEELFDDNISENSDVYVVKTIKENSVILDGNHPFAGKDLIFDVHILNIEEASFTELEQGYPDEVEEDFSDDNDDFENNSQERWY